MRCVRFVRPQFVRLAFVPWLLAVCAPSATAEDISGTITTTKMIVEDSRLVGDVTCTTTTTPCLQFGAPNITLHLSGFMVTGPANPDDTTTCNPTSGMPFSDGISNGTIAATSQPGVRVIGPGMVQKFRRHGLFFVGAPGVSTNVTVRNVTSHANCFSGLLTNGMTNSLLDGVVSIRNAANSGTAPCGGNCLVNSNNNRIVNGLFGGNGSVCAAALCAAPPTTTSNNDFGMRLIAGSAGNLVEGNSLTGNTNGLLIQAGAAGNTIRTNIIVGNPPSQLSRTYGPIGFDIKDEATANGARNTFERNWCISYSGPGPSPCPSFPGVAAPTISAVTATPGVLWPPNGQMVPVTVAVTVSDDLDPTPVCRITNVTSNDSSGSSNWTVTAPLGLQLRAERGGLGGARVYSITVTCTNTSMLSATALVTVVVPHDLR